LGSEGVCPVMKRRAAPLPLAEPGMAGGLLVVLALGHAAVAAGTRLARNASTAAALRGPPGGPVADLPRGAGRRTAAANDTLGGLRPPAVHLAARLGQERKAGAPCACEPHSSSWVRCQRTVPKCVWIDLGAADGNTLKAFLNNQYGPVGNCPSAAWEAMLVEANPRFNAPLQEMASRWPGMVHLFESTAAYMCPAQTSFYLDTVTSDHNYWGSSLSANAVDVRNSGLQKVTVPMVNLMQVLYENTIPADWVMVKMDIEGAEWDILPCLALSPTAPLVDRLYVEFHNQSMGLVGTDQATMDAAQQMLRLRGVDIPSYFSNTL